MPFTNAAPSPQKLTTAIFVDAGYLFAGGSTALFGTHRTRQQVSLERPELLIEKILELGRSQLGQPLGLLRTYWYDGASDGIPTPAQKAISALPRFKIRLGRLSGGGQKGVDGLIILDLINLSLNRVLDVAILLSGDEDLRESVLFAQGNGVTVVVAGTPETAKSKQSDTLIREADFHLVLPVDLLAAHIIEIQPPLADAISMPEVDESGIVVVSTEPQGAVQLDDSALEILAIEMVARPDFALETFEGRTRLSSGSDRVLISHLVKLTNKTPVAETVLRRARAKCVEVSLRK